METDLTLAEKTLREREAFLNSLLDAIPIPVFYKDRDGLYRGANKAFEAFLGIAREDLNGKTVLDINPPDLAHIYQTKDAELFRKGGTQQYDSQMKNAHGLIRDVIFNKAVFTDSEGTITGLIGAILDITERKQAEQALVAEKDLSESIIDSMPGVFYCYDDQLRFKRWNRNFERVSGYSAEELLHASPLDFFAGHGRETVERKIGEVFSKGESSAEADFVSKDGRKTPYFFTGLKVRIDNADHLVGVGIDISEIKQAKEALRASEAKYHSIFENSLEGIYRTTKEGRFLMANTAFCDQLGYSSFEELAATVTNVATQLYVRPEDREYLLQMLEEESAVKGFETRFYRKDKRIVWVRINITAVRDESGNILYYDGIDEDTTQRKEVEREQARSAAQVRKAMMDTIHALVSMSEFRDPYTTGHQNRVADIAAAIAEELGLPEEQISGIRIAGLIHDVGKICIPTEILSKPGQLSQIEMDLIRSHVAAGYEIIKDIEFPWPIRKAVLQHHERLDGSGYPSGISGDDIVMEASIIAVADVVEAMASHRPYRAAQGLEAALEEIEKNKGILYDEKVAEACLRLYRDKDNI